MTIQTKRRRCWILKYPDPVEEIPPNTPTSNGIKAQIIYFADAWKRAPTEQSWWQPDKPWRPYLKSACWNSLLMSQPGCWRQYVGSTQHHDALVHAEEVTSCLQSPSLLGKDHCFHCRFIHVNTHDNIAGIPTKPLSAQIHLSISRALFRKVPSVVVLSKHKER